MKAMKQTIYRPSKLPGIARQKLSNWNPVNSRLFLTTPVPDNILPCVSIGASIAKTVWIWLMLLEWPSGEDAIIMIPMIGEFRILN